jgi:ribosomal protein S18 acetylase RimI-like enzyme
MARSSLIEALNFSARFWSLTSRHCPSDAYLCVFDQVCSDASFFVHRAIQEFMLVGAQGHVGAAPSAMPYKFMNLRKISRADSADLIQKLRKLERKTFPSSEVFPFEQSILSRQNTEILVGLSDATTPGRLVAYAVCVKSNHRLLLHKVCVSPAHRRQGLGTRLLELLVQQARTWSCRGIDLWVHQENYIAIHLYTTSGFLVQDTVANYYAPGQTGIKMSHPLQP